MSFTKPSSDVGQSKPGIDQYLEKRVHVLLQAFFEQFSVIISHMYQTRMNIYGSLMRY